MGERKTRVNFNEDWVDGFEVPIDESRERWSEYTLEDGTVLRAKINIVSAVRIPDEYDQSGNPVYLINANPIMGIVEAPEDLKKKR